MCELDVFMLTVWTTETE